MKMKSEKAIVMGIAFVLATVVFIVFGCASAATIYHAAADNTTTQNINITQSTSLEDDFVLDFSQTQFDFIDPMDAGPGIFKFKGTNTGTKNLLIFFDWCCKSEGVEVGRPVAAPQGATPLAPGESMWFKILPEGCHCGYDASVPQTITRTMSMSFSDNNNNWPNQEDNSFSVEKTIQIKVIDYGTLAGDVTIQGVTVDEEGNPIPYVQIALGGYRWKVVIQSDATGHFSYSIAESPVYFLIAQKEFYRAATIEIDGSNVQDFYTVTLIREPSPISVSASLINSVTGNIGFYRCAATKDESKLLLVNGMENWEDEGLKNQSKLYLLDTNSGEILWTHDMGWGSWTADISDDGRYVVFGTKLEGFQTGPEGFVNYIRLLNGTNGFTIWQKNITTENFPATTTGEFYTRGVKFSHSGEYIFVPVPYEDGYLLNRSDGSIKWHRWVGQNIREVLFTQDDQYVYIPSGSGWLYKFKVEDGSQVWKQWIGCWAMVNGFDLSPDEEYIAVGSKAGYLTVINTSDGSVRFTKDFHGGSATCRFSPDGTRLIVGGAHSFTMMLDLDGNVLWRYYAIGCDIRWSGDGRLIFSNSGNVFDIYGTMLYDILSSGGNTQVGWVNSNATRFIFAVRNTPASENNIIEVYSIERSGNTQPVASFTHSPANPAVDQMTTFDASASYDPDGNITNYKWAFGNENTTNTIESIIAHSYSSPGKYTVDLTVTDDGGLTGTKTQNITISEQGDWIKESGIRIQDGSVPYILRLDNGLYRMYYSSPEGSIFSAISEEGINFTKELGVILSGIGVLGDPEWQVHGATVIRLDDGSYRMYYVGASGEGGPYGCGIHRIYSAISSDGLNFTREGVRIESVGTIDDGWASVPEIVRTFDGRYRLYYCSNGAKSIASAISDDGLNFTREYDSGIGNGTGVFGADPAVCKLSNGTYWMFFTSPGGPMPPWYLEKGIYSARSTDGVNFTKDFGVRVSPGGIYDSVNTYDPTVIALPDGRFRMYYGGESDQGVVTLSAISPFVTPVIYDTGLGTYPSIAGTHTGTITPNQDITVQKMYTYPCTGTGGHTEHVTFYYSTGTKLAEGHWNGYTGDWHNITFDSAFTLQTGETYNYTIRTGSYPQIIHKEIHNTTDGTITCTQFKDANGRTYDNWIPAIRLWTE